MTSTTSLPLADPSDLAVRLGAEENDPLVELSLRRASDRFRGAVEHPVSFVPDDTVVLDGNGSDTLMLPAAPVTAVTSVTVAGILVTDYSVSPRLGMLRRRYLWPYDFGNVSVVYSHGYTDIPGDIQDAVIEQAEMQYYALAGVYSATLGPQIFNFGHAGNIGVSGRWSECVARYQLNRGDRAA